MKIKVNIHPQKEKFVHRQFDKDEYTLISEKDISYPIGKHNLCPVCDNYNEGDARFLLLILDGAVDEILSFIEWGKYTKHNYTEVCGFMIGHHYYDERKKIYYSEVEKVFTEAFLQLSTDSMFTIDQQLYIYNKENESNCKFIGWFHTHPNSLSVFMSSTDLLTQTRFFSDDLGYAVVINPHRQLWKAFRSVRCYDTKCAMVKKMSKLSSDDDITVTDIPKMQSTDAEFIEQGAALK